MSNTTETVHVPQWKLRRVAPRALQVLQRHRDSTTLQHFEQTLNPAVTKFVELYDAGRAYAAARGTAAADQGPVRDLQMRMQGWIGPVARDIPTFDLKSFGDHVDVPEDVVAAAQRMLEMMRMHVSAGNPALPYAAELEQNLTPAIEAARLYCEQSHTRLAQEQAALAETRAAAVTMHKELMAFRKSLRAVIGASHRDYQQLRTHKQTNGAADGPVVDPTPPAATPAAATAPTPVPQLPSSATQPGAVPAQ